MTTDTTITDRDDWKTKYETQCAGTMSRISELVSTRNRAEEAERRVKRLEDAIRVTLARRHECGDPATGMWDDTAEYLVTPIRNALAEPTT